MSDQKKNTPYHIKVLTGPGRIASDPDDNKTSWGGRIFIALLFAVIVFSLFAMLLFGVTMYKSINDARISNDDRRYSLSLITNSVRMNDVTDAVGVGTGPEGRSLVLTEEINGSNYETRFYTFEGKIVQEYALAQTPYTPLRAREVVASDTFDFSYTDGVLTIWTDHGESTVTLRSVRRSVG